LEGNKAELTVSVSMPVAGLPGLREADDLTVEHYVPAASPVAA
jgi:hypothetical protein